MSSAGGSGPHDPGDHGGLSAHVSVQSGPHQPGDPNPKKTGADASAIELTTQSVSLKIGVREPEPFTVKLITPADGKIRLISVKVHISDGTGNVGNPEVLATDCELKPGETEFPLTQEQLDQVMPAMRVGTHVGVDVTFAAPHGTALQIGVIGTGHPHHRAQSA